MEISINFDSGTEELISDFSIRETVLEVVDRINNTELPLHTVKVCISENPVQIIPEIGSGGWTETPNKIWIYFDSANENFIEKPKERIMSAVAHEFGHAFREMKFPFPGTLLDDMVAEGIADHLDLEIVGGEGKPWSKALTGNEIEALFEKAGPLLGKRNHDHFTWFFGSEEHGIPKWTGYALGFDIVDKYLRKQNTHISKIIHLDSNEFLRTYGS